jgi:hypothetical protein
MSVRKTDLLTSLKVTGKIAVYSQNYKTQITQIFAVGNMHMYCMLKQDVPLNLLK